MFKIGFFPYGSVGPSISPSTFTEDDLFSFRTVLNNPPLVYGWRYFIYTVQILNVPTTTQINLNWTLTSGSTLPRLFYYINHPEVTTTGATAISALAYIPGGPYNSPWSLVTPSSVGFTEYIQGISSITVSSNDFITLVVFYNGTYTPGPTSVSSGTITNVNNAVMATFNLGFTEF